MTTISRSFPDLWCDGLAGGLSCANSGAKFRVARNKIRNSLFIIFKLYPYNRAAYPNLSKKVILLFAAQNDRDIKGHRAGPLMRKYYPNMIFKDDKFCAFAMVCLVVGVQARRGKIHGDRR